MFRVKEEFFDPWKTFDANAEEKQAVLERTKIREVFKAEFRKKYTDPYRPTSGYIFDPAIQRNYSSRFSVDHHFKPSKYIIITMVLMAIPFVIGGKFFYQTRKLHQQKIKAGQVTYKDREWDNMLNP